MTTEKIQLFGSDLDGTLLGNPEAARRFKDASTLIGSRERKETITRCKRGFAQAQQPARLLSTNFFNWESSAITIYGSVVTREP